MFGIIIFWDVSHNMIAYKVDETEISCAPVFFLWLLFLLPGSLRLVQHVETIQAPNSWTSMRSKSWSEIAWVEKHFKACSPIYCGWFILPNAIERSAIFLFYLLSNKKQGGPGMITTLIQVLGSANVCCTLMRSHANAPLVRQTYAVGMFCQFEPNNVAMQLHHSVSFSRWLVNYCIYLFDYCGE